jgi:hypothetical protein
MVWDDMPALSSKALALWQEQGLAVIMFPLGSSLI